jgi:hypothetical protein
MNKAAGSLEELREKIELFLLDHPSAVLTEPGREVMDLGASSYSLSVQYDKLLWHIWNEHANMVRQITGLQREKPGRLELRFQRFGKGPAGTLVLADSRATPEQLDRRARRVQFSRTLRRWLLQLFPQWKVEELTSEPDWGRSLSGRYARGVLARGRQAWAVIGTGDQEDPSAAEGILTYGLIWLDWLRQRNLSRVVTGLKIFLPSGKADTTLQRLAWMDKDLARWEVYEAGEEIRIGDSADVGNLKTRLSLLREPAPLPPGLRWASERIAGLSSQIETRSGADGLRNWSVRGLVFARETARGIVFGLGRAESHLEEASFVELEDLIHRILRFRRADTEDPTHPFYRIQAEHWMQSILSRQPHRIGHDLVSEPIYEQVLAISGVERGLMDLLALNMQGRLVLMELKASEDIHLPLQALDYWMRVHWHHERGELARLGYFADREISSQSPLLLLVSPGLQFHSSCETVLRYFAPSVEVVRVGLNENWREQLQVVFRAPRQRG